MMNWYSIDGNLAIVERGPVSKQGAMRIIEEYNKRGGIVWEYGEDALAATTFGFQKSAGEFIEICFAAAGESSFTYELSIPRKFLFLTIPRIIHKEKVFERVEDLKAVVSSFYDLDSVAFQNLLGS